MTALECPASPQHGPGRTVIACSAPAGAFAGVFHDSTVRLPPGPAPRPASSLLVGATFHGT